MTSIYRGSSSRPVERNLLRVAVITVTPGGTTQRDIAMVALWPILFADSASP
jgi:hypothetical protein